MKIKILRWDWKQQPNWKKVQKAIRKMNVPSSEISIKEVDSGSDEFVIVICDEKITQKHAQKIYDAEERFFENIGEIYF